MLSPRWSEPRSVEQLGDRFGAGAAGVLQSAWDRAVHLHLQPQAGLVDVVRAALVNSIWPTWVLVLGQHSWSGAAPRATAGFRNARGPSTVLISVAALSIPSLAFWIHTPANSVTEHIVDHRVGVAAGALRLSLPASLPGDRRERGHSGPPAQTALARWLAVGLKPAPASSAFVSVGSSPRFDRRYAHTEHLPRCSRVWWWSPSRATRSKLRRHPARRAGQSAFRLLGRAELALQISLVLARCWCFISQFTGLAALTLVFSPMLVVVLLLAAVLARSSRSTGVDLARGAT